MAKNRLNTDQYRAPKLQADQSARQINEKRGFHEKVGPWEQQDDNRQVIPETKKSFHR